MKSKVKDPNALGFRTFLGTTLMGSTDAIGAAVMTNLFMMYLTDYAGIGKWGAILGSALLMAARIFDAVNDPIEGWIMDRAKVGRYGKYRPFILLSILMTGVGVTGLFALPTAISNAPVLISVWVLLFYLIFDAGSSFFAPNLVYRTLTLDSNQRSKLLVGPRIYSMAISIFAASFLAIVNGVNAAFNDLHTSFAVTVAAAMAITAVLSVVGISLFREKHHVERDKEDNVRILDIFRLLKENKALRIRLLDLLFSGFIWTFLFATMVYYMKWGYCVDLSPGAVDTGRLGTFTMISSLLMLFPMIVGTVIAGPVMRKIGSPIKFHRILILAQAVPCLVLFILHVTGILLLSPVPFILCSVIVTLAIGMDYIPGETLSIETMDYEIYRTGKDRSALCNAATKFLTKAQSAVSTGMVGIILTAIGYEVDSATDTFVGELSAIPTMLTWFIVIMGLVPAILGLVSWLILRHYPVTDEVRAEMAEKLGRTEPAETEE